LFGVVLNGSLETVQLLVAAGADPHRSQMWESGQVVDAAEFAGLNGRQSIAGFCGPWLGVRKLWPNNSSKPTPLRGAA
jgi:hypothetical protein